MGRKAVAVGLLLVWISAQAFQLRPVVFSPESIPASLLQEQLSSGFLEPGYLLPAHLSAQKPSEISKVSWPSHFIGGAADFCFSATFEYLKSPASQGVLCWKSSALLLLYPAHEFS